jgi:hypothetical protein
MRLVHHSGVNGDRKNGAQGDITTFFPEANLTSSDVALFETMTGTTNISAALTSGGENMTSLLIDISSDREDGSLKGDVTTGYLQNLLGVSVQMENAGQYGLSRDVTIASPSSVILFEVKIRQIHVTAGQDVDGENIPPLAKANLEERRSQVPVMPLTPSHGVCRVICCWDLQRSCCLFSIHVDRDCSATIGGVKKIGSKGSRPRRVDSDVEPFSGFGPANIGQVSRRHSFVKGIVVERIRLPIELRI